MRVHIAVFFGKVFLFLGQGPAQSQSYPNDVGPLKGMQLNT